MATGEEYEALLRTMHEILELLRSESEMRSGRRMTDAIYRPTRQMIDAQKKECDFACEKRIEKVADDLKHLKSGIYSEVEKKGKDEASKTREQFVLPIQERIKRLEESVLGKNGDDLDDRVKLLEKWLKEEKERRKEKAEESKFSKTWILAVLAFLISSGLGIAGVVIALLKLK